MSHSELLALLKTELRGTPWQNRVFWVGGSVRDQLLGTKTQDLDLVVEQEGGAEDFSLWLHQKHSHLFSRPHPLGRGYPIWQLVYRDAVELEIADTQAEAFPDPKTRQRITRPGNLAEDCARRDFTVNMLYQNVVSDEILDPSGCGLEDIRSGFLRAHPRVSISKMFSDDPLRMLRLVRFCTRFRWKVDEKLVAGVRECAPRVEILSGERIRDELFKMIEHHTLSAAFRLMKEWGLLRELFPELLPMVGCTQDALYHSEGDVWTHTLLVMENAPATRVLQLAALLHDVGKPGTRSEHGVRVKFLEHEKLSVELAETFLTRLKVGKDLRERILKLIALHLRGGDVRLWTSLKPARKLLRDAEGVLEDLLLLIEADSKSSWGPAGEPRVDHLPQLHQALSEAQKIPLSRKALLSGTVLMKELHLRPGPQLRDIQNLVSEWEDEAAAQGNVLTAEQALARLKKMSFTE